MSAGAPIANYAAAKRAGDFVFLSGAAAVRGDSVLVEVEATLYLPR
jgi:enamine deaminase RidA (YjgF/YER057c/UK114 family)